MWDFWLNVGMLSRDSVGCVFLLSGLAKAVTIGRFRESLLYLPYMRPSWSYVFGITLPPLELFAGVGLLANLAWARFLAISLIASFLGITVIVLALNLQISCHCFGAWADQHFSGQTVRHNIVLLILVFISLGAPDPETVLLGAYKGLFVLILYSILTEVRRNARLMTELRHRGMT
jgi:hypothetical protein